MRIISGSFKGKKILQPNDLKTRPLKDLTKESIFNLINHSNKFRIDLQKSNILDLFSGVGSFGMECLSRGARKVIFVENYAEVLMILKKNLASLKGDMNFEIIEKDIINGNIFSIFSEKFDVVFLDPPFKEKKIDKVLTNISDSGILKQNSIIIIHRHRNEVNSFPANFKIVEEKVYGLSKILFLNQ